MKDGMGRVDYVYNNLSQLKSEKRFFSDLASTASGGNYTLEYDYNLAGELKSIKDPYNRINYSYNEAGQLKTVKGDPFGGVSDYVTDIKYRAWGDLKETTYGNHLKVSTQYDTGLRLKHFDLKGSTQNNRTGMDTAPPPSTAMSIDYDHYRDGALRFADDGVDNRFDRAYEYDHVGRLKETFVDVLARKFFNPNNTEAMRVAPYRQSYRYDEWDNLTSRNSLFWSSGGENFAVQYDSRNRVTDPQWAYDAAGNETSNRTANLTYDAAQNNVKVESLTGEVKTQQWFDGNSQVVKRSRTETTEADAHGNKFT